MRRSKVCAEIKLLENMTVNLWVYLRYRLIFVYKQRHNLNWFILHWKQWPGTWVGSFNRNWKRMQRFSLPIELLIQFQFHFYMHFPCSSSVFPCSWCQNLSNAIATMRDLFDVLVRDWACTMYTAYCYRREREREYG